MKITVDIYKNSEQSQQTNSYDVQASTKKLITGFSEALPTQSKWLNVWHIAELTSALMGNRLLVGDASHYIFDFARRQGYDIPAVPYAGNGELKKFLADEGVANIPEWYKKVGFPAESYQSLYDKTIVAASNGKGERKAILLEGQLYNDYGDFKTLSESGFIKKAKPQQLDFVLEELFKWLKITGN